MIKAYHFTGDNLRDGRTLPPIGETLVHDGPIEMCKSGLHASEHAFDAMTYAPGEWLHRVDCEGDIEEQSDKLVCRRRTITATIDATPVLSEFAKWCALEVINLWDAPAVVVEFLNGDDSKRAAALDAAGDAAWASGDAAGAAARAAAGAARAERDAWDAAGAAAGAAARAAAGAAGAAARAAARAARAARDARDAARGAAGAAQRDKFAEMVNEAFADA